VRPKPALGSGREGLGRFWGGEEFTPRVEYMFLDGLVEYRGTEEVVACDTVGKQVDCCTYWDADGFAKDFTRFNFFDEMEFRRAADDFVENK